LKKKKNGGSQISFQFASLKIAIIVVDFE